MVVHRGSEVAKATEEQFYALRNKTEEQKESKTVKTKKSENENK